MHALQRQQLGYSQHDNTKISQLKKKHNAIAYHWVQECVIAEIVRFAHVNSVSNLADFLTKPLGTVAFWRVVKPVVFKATVWTDSVKNMLSAVENG